MLSFYADGDLRGMDARVFFEAVSELLLTAREIDRAFGDVDLESTWRLAELSSGSALVGATSSRGDEVDAAVYHELALTMRDARHESHVPVERIRGLIALEEKVRRGGLGGLSIGFGRDFVPLDAAAIAVLKDRLEGMLNTIGSVTGTVERLIVPDRGEWFLSVREVRSERAVRCYFSREDEDLLTAARHALRKAARVRGRVVRQGVRGRVQEVRAVRSIEILPTTGDITSGFGRGPSTPPDVIWEQRG